jgi:hypothetical protein
MKKFKIAEFDNDYNSLLRTFDRTFNNRKEADEWCVKAAWTGADYMVLREIADDK